jgi:hypothetical protein
MEGKMKKIIMSAIVMVAIILSLGGCYYHGSGVHDWDDRYDWNRGHHRGGGYYHHWDRDDDHRWNRRYDHRSDKKYDNKY